MVGRSKEGAARSWRRLALGTTSVVGLVAACYAGSLFLPSATAESAPPTKPATAPTAPALPPAPGQPEASDYSKRPVAFMHDNEAVTREQLGEYLIARFGAEKLPLLINRLIIEEACRAKGIEVTPAEVEASLAKDLAGMGNLSEKDFVERVLKQYKKTLYEWKEDVIRPKLLMSKLVHDRVTVTEEEIQAGFQAYHGEKIDCQMIFWPKGEENIALQQYASIRNSDEEFDRKARMQANANLAATGGHIAPIGHRTTGSDEVEKAAFRLQPGEVSAVIDTPDGAVVIKCLKRIPPDTTVSLEKERSKLYQEVFDKKVQIQIPIAFAELQKQANVKKLLADPGRPEENLAETTHTLLNDGAPPAGGKATPVPGAH